VFASPPLITLTLLFAFLSQPGAAAQSEDHTQQQQQVCDGPESLMALNLLSLCFVFDIDQTSNY
jgi:hypothetical protein